MSFPNIPNITPTINLSREEVINLLLASIALEELSLAHIVNAEAEKIQAALGTLSPGISVPPTTFQDLINLDRSVSKILRDVISKEMLLLFKLEDIIDIITASTTTASTTTASTTTASTTTASTTTASTTTASTTTVSTTTTASTTTSAPLTTTNTATATFTFNNGNAVQSVTTAQANYSSATPFSGTYTKTGPSAPVASGQNIVLGGVNLGQLPNFLLFFDNGSVDANWQGATKGFLGNVAVNGLVASERTSGTVPYAGVLSTNAPTLGAWNAIVTDPINVGQASGQTNQTTLINTLGTELISAFQQINALTANLVLTPSTLNGLNTTGSPNTVFVINMVPDSGTNYTISSQINVTGKPGDIFILRWDNDQNFSNGYQGIVTFQSGGAIVPHGGLTPASFINVAGDINSSGGGSNPPAPYPQGPYNNGVLINGGANFNGGGFFTGYWLTTGAPNAQLDATGLFVGPTHSLSNGIFVGGWYTLTTQFSMTSGTSGTAIPNLQIIKEVSVDNGATFQPAPNPPGPTLPPGTNPQYKYIVTNIGGTTLTNIVITDNKVGTIGTIPILAPGESSSFIAMGV